MRRASCQAGVKKPRVGVDPRRWNIRNQNKCTDAKVWLCFECEFRQVSTLHALRELLRIGFLATGFSPTARSL